LGGSGSVDGIPTIAAIAPTPRSAIRTGNGWLFQEVTARLPGRVDANDTTFTSSTELAGALRRAEAAHGEHEKRTGQRDADWPNWYAEYIVREQAGKQLPS
jgi:hypothetical protein